MYPRRDLYKALNNIQIKLDELASKKDDNWWRQFHTLHKADGNCPYLGPVSNQLDPSFIDREVQDLIKAYNEFRKSG